MRRCRIGRRALGAVAATLFAACATTSPPHLALLDSARCPRQGGSALDARAETADLECALVRARDPGAPPAARARAAFLLADRAFDDPSRREALADEAVRAAEEALRAHDDDGAAHYWLATSLGLVAEAHITQALELLPRMIAALERARERAPATDDGGPARVLGKIYLRAPAWPAGVGDVERAVELTREAATTFPHQPVNQLFFAQALWEDEGEAAREETRTALAASCELFARDWHASAERWREEIASLDATVGGVGACTALR